MGGTGGGGGVAGAGSFREGVRGCCYLDWQPERLWVPGVGVEAAVCSGLHSESPSTGCLATIVHLIAIAFENKNQFPL